MTDLDLHRSRNLNGLVPEVPGMEMLGIPLVGEQDLGRYVKRPGVPGGTVLDHSTDLDDGGDSEAVVMKGSYASVRGERGETSVMRCWTHADRYFPAAVAAVRVSFPSSLI